MGLTERHWFENEDMPENYEWALEDAMYNSHINKNDITQEAVLAVAQYLLQEEKSLLFNYRDTRYRMSVEPEPPKAVKRNG